MSKPVPDEIADFVATMERLRVAAPLQYTALLGAVRALYLESNPTLPEDATLPERWAHGRAVRGVRPIDFDRAAQLRIAAGGEP